MKKKLKLKPNTQFYILVSLSAIILFSLLYVMIVMVPVTKDQIECLNTIGKTKCSDFTKIVVVPDKISDSGYVCASFPDPLNNYPKFTAAELKSCYL